MMMMCVCSHHAVTVVATENHSAHLHASASLCVYALALTLTGKMLGSAGRPVLHMRWPSAPVVHSASPQLVSASPFEKTCAYRCAAEFDPADAFRSSRVQCCRPAHACISRVRGSGTWASTSKHRNVEAGVGFTYGARSPTAAGHHKSGVNGEDARACSL